MEPLERIREFWDADAACYDRSASHHPSTPLERAAWAGVLARLLPAPPARILDVGAGTGFLSLTAARLGHRVTALDLSAEMLERLRVKAAAAGLDIEAVEGRADQPPGDGFDAVIERHLVWTLPAPEATLRRWRRATSGGWLVLFESAWGSAAQPSEVLKAWGRQALRRLRKVAPAHHAHYPDDVLTALPFGSGIGPGELVELVESSGWPGTRIERLHNVEWAMTRSLPPSDRFLGATAPCCAVVAG
ncbi:MAG: methyltransferase domain-containing protein [Pseudonocardiaceae bacterium]|nr:methyltransferase domain-containing protein [Pseudonocardiaceae bacterium]